MEMNINRKKELCHLKNIHKDLPNHEAIEKWERLIDAIQKANSVEDVDYFLGWGKGYIVAMRDQGHVTTARKFDFYEKISGEAMNRKIDLKKP